MSESEAVQTRLSLEEWDESPWEWGVYIERNDGRDGEDDWTPLVYGKGGSFERALESYLSFHNAARVSPKTYRHPRIVRRAVSPWEVRDYE